MKRLEMKKIQSRHQITGELQPRLQSVYPNSRQSPVYGLPVLSCKRQKRR